MYTIANRIGYSVKTSRQHTASVYLVMMLSYFITRDSTPGFPEPTPGAGDPGHFQTPNPGVFRPPNP